MMKTNIPMYHSATQQKADYYFGLSSSMKCLDSFNSVYWAKRGCGQAWSGRSWDPERVGGVCTPVAGPWLAHD